MKLKYDTTTVGGKLDVYKEYLLTNKNPVFKCKGQSLWRELGKHASPEWNWSLYDYNYIEPEVPEIIPWTYDNCPKAPMVLKWRNAIYSVVNIDKDGVYVFMGDNRTWLSWEYLSEKIEYSTDGKLWLPCGLFKTKI